jgi:uncharacterized protein (DUF58 family)
MIPAELLSHLNRLSLVTRRRQSLALHGERRSRARGSSLEFVDYRGYAYGDDLRRIDWNLYGRTNGLFLKQFEAERALAVHLLLDASRSMDFGDPSKLGYARDLIAALGYVGLNGFGQVSVAALADGAEQTFGPAAGRQRSAPLLAAVAGVEPRGQTDLGRAVATYAYRQATPGLAILVSDLLSPTWEEGLRGLLAHRSEVVILHVLAPEELDPAPAEEVRLVDRETGRTVDVRLDRAAIDRYRRRLEQWCEAIEGLCIRSGVRYQRLSTATPLAEALLEKLIRGGILK